MSTPKKDLVFIVDDEIMSLELTHQLIAPQGYSNIKKFDNSSSLLHSLVEQPSLIFLDYNIDHLNGIEILKKIKRSNPEAIVVMLSGQESISVAVNCLKYGAFDYIIKSQLSPEKIKALLFKIDQTKEILKKRNRKGILSKIISTIQK